MLGPLATASRRTPPVLILQQNFKQAMFLFITQFTINMPEFPQSTGCFVYYLIIPAADLIHFYQIIKYLMHTAVAMEIAVP